MANESTTEAPAHTATVEDLGPCRKRIEIEIPPEALEKRLDESFEQIKHEIRLPGFRPGKAPRALIERRFGKYARDEARTELMTAALQEAVREHDLHVLGDPDKIDRPDEEELEKGGPLRFSVEVEVAPDFALPPLEGIEAKRPVIEVTDEMIDREVERLAVNEGSLEEQERSEPGDYCVGRGVMKTPDGEVALDISDAVVQVPPKDGDGSGMILGVVVDDLAKQFGTPTSGQAVTVETTGPEQHENEAVRGQPITIEHHVDKVQRVIPATPEQLVEKYGLEDVQQLREAIARRLNQRILLEQNSAVRGQIADYLLDNTKLELPENLSARQAERNLERRRLELMHEGADPMEIEQRMAELRAASAEAAQRELKLFFILSRIAQDRRIDATEPEINARVAQMAAERGERPEQLKAELARTNRLPLVAQQIREHKTLDELRSAANVEDLPAEAFNEWMASRNEQRTAG